MAISKSAMKAMGCETYYATVELTPNSAARLIESPFARVGTEFHAYRQAYVDHLVEAAVPLDLDWVREYLGRTPMSTETRKLIEADRGYAVDPDGVVGAELFLSVTDAFEPLEQLTGLRPGYRSEHPQALVSGTIDLLEMKGREASVTDWKSGWSTATVSDYEPPTYAALVMAHFPQVEAVNFRWEFCRVAAVKDTSYARDDLTWIHDMIRGEAERERELRERYEAGGALGVNPWAGLCPFCPARCPLRQQATSTQLIIPTIQTEADARQAAAVLYAAEQVAGYARAALKPYLDQVREVRLGPDHVLEIAAAARTEYSLPDALDVLGLELRLDQLPICQKGQNKGKVETPLWNVPIESLTVSASKLNQFAKAKVRAGLAEKLERIARRGSASTTVRIRRLQEADRQIEGADGEEAA